MRPDKQKQMMAYLTRPARRLIKSGQVQFASDIARPEPKQAIREINLFNEFNVRNSKADGGRIGYNVGTLVGYGTKIPGVKPLLKKGAEALGGTAIGKRVYDTFFSDVQDTGDGTVIAPDANEMEREAKKIREMTKPVGFPAEPPIKIDTTTGDSEPPKIDTKESFPAETQQLPKIEGFPAETQQLPIIFENKKVENVKKKFDKVIELYQTTGPGGPKRAEQINSIRNKKFAEDVKNIVDTTYGGNAAALAENLGIERVRINSLLNKHGIKLERAGNKTIQSIFLKQDKNKLSVPDLTTNIKGNQTYLIDRAKERFVNYDNNKNKFLNYRDIAEIVGVNLPDKTAQDFFQTKLRNANKKVGIKTKKGSGKEILYNLGDAINSLTKVNLTKPIAGTGRIHDKLRSKFETDKDKLGYNTRTEVLRVVRDAQNNIFGDEAILRAGEQYGHAEAIANQQNYPKLFKKSNASDISTLVFQDPILNQDVLQAYGSVKTGIEQKRQPFLKTLESLVGKKSTTENIQIANEALNGLNELNNLARIQIKRFQKTNRFVRDQENRVPDFTLILPEEGQTFKSGFLKIDMSNIDPSVSVGRILEINPNAKTFNDLTKKQKEIYKENLKNQMADYLSYFYKEFKADKDDIETFTDTILNAKIGTKVKKADGGSMNIDLSFFAGGGIAKEAGDSSGPPPERGPNPQGLLSLMKRVKNI